MADITPIFDKLSAGSIVISGSDIWVDLLSYGPDANSPIPSGKQIWVGFVTCIAVDKAAQFSLRPNIAGQSAGTVGTTQLRGFTNVAQGESADMDLHWNGAILTLSPIVVSTGVEKLWLRIKAGSSSSASYEFLTYYTVY